MASTNKLLEALARAWMNDPPAKWYFPLSVIKLNDKASKVATFGALWYENSLYEIGLVVKVGEYVFYLERLTSRGRQVPPGAAQPSKWIVAAFGNKVHYSFHSIPDDGQTRGFFFTWLLATIWPILAPEEFRDLGTSFTVSWETSSKEKIIEQITLEKR